MGNPSKAPDTLSSDDLNLVRRFLTIVNLQTFVGRLPFLTLSDGSRVVAELIDSRPDKVDVSTTALGIEPDTADWLASGLMSGVAKDVKIRLEGADTESDRYIRVRIVKESKKGAVSGSRAAIKRL